MRSHREPRKKDSAVQDSLGVRGSGADYCYCLWVRHEVLDKDSSGIQMNGDALRNRKRKMQVRVKGRLQLDRIGLGW